MTMHSSEYPIAHFSIRGAGENAKFVEYTPPFGPYLGTYKAPEGNYYEPNIFIEVCNSFEEYERFRAYSAFLNMVHERFWSRNAHIVERTKALLFERCQLALAGHRGLTVTQYDVRGLKRYTFGLIYISPHSQNERTFIGYTRLYKPHAALPHGRARQYSFYESIPRIPDALLGCEMSSLSPHGSPYTESAFIPDIDISKLDVWSINDSKIDVTSLYGGDQLVEYVSGIILLKRKLNADALSW
jgi:hypothetical protein